MGSRRGERLSGSIVQVYPPNFDVGLNLADLELFHVYVTSTYGTLSLSPTLRNFWRITVPLLAILIALATPKGLGSDNTFTEEDGYKDWMILIKGTKRLHETLGEDLSNHPLSPLLRFGATELGFRRRSSAVVGICDEEIFLTLQHYINDSYGDPVLMSPYREAINNLRFVAGCSLDSEGIDAFVWIYRCADSIVQFLEYSTQEALVTLAYFLYHAQETCMREWMKTIGLGFMER
ncbi:hypothetical protein QSH57_010247 [Fusarium oxysporum f. sp. vasinfectum]|nr:hypothetical protein QSH57_010247 [Fusarium oxysporum f. sp. vasinfectum]